MLTSGDHPARIRFSEYARRSWLHANGWAYIERDSATVTAVVTSDGLRHERTPGSRAPDGSWPVMANVDYDGRWAQLETWANQVIASLRGPEHGNFGYPGGFTAPTPSETTRARRDLIRAELQEMITQLRAARDPGMDAVQVHVTVEGNRHVRRVGVEPFNAAARDRVQAIAGSVDDQVLRWVLDGRVPSITRGADTLKVGLTAAGVTISANVLP